MNKWIECAGYLTAITSISAGAWVYDGAYAGLAVFGFLLLLVLLARAST